MARELFTTTVTWADTADKDANNNARLKTAANATWSVLAVASDGSTSSPTVYGSRTGASTASTGTTNSTGTVEFWAEPGEYKITITDASGQSRFSPKDIYWNSGAIQPGNLSGDLISNDSRLDLATVGADVLRQAVPIGAVLDWFRPASTIPVPSGFEIADGRSILAANHDFGTGTTVVLPDLRNTFIVGADTPDTPTNYRTTGGGRSSNLSGSYTGDALAGTAKSDNSANGAPGIRGAGGDHTDISHSHNVAVGAHTHSIPAHTHTIAAHTHGLGSHTHTISAHTHSIPAHAHGIPAHTHAVPAHTHSQWNDSGSWGLAVQAATITAGGIGIYTRGAFGSSPVTIGYAATSGDAAFPTNYNTSALGTNNNTTALATDANSSALATGTASGATDSVALTTDSTSLTTSGASSSSGATDPSTLARVPRYYGLLKIMKVRRA